jgi:hypothetical protein
MMETFLAPLVALAVIALGALWMTATGRRGGGSSISGAGGRAAAGARSRPKRQPKPIALDLTAAPGLDGVLGGLPGAFIVRGPVRTGEGPIPSVVLGPTGLWVLAAVEVKGHINVIDGSVAIGGRTSDAASLLWRRAHALAEAMAGGLAGEMPPTQAALVFVDPGAEIAKREAMGVALLTPGELEETLVEGRRRLDPATIADYEEALARLL